jgi:leucyl-tRNA synthetase
MILGDGGVKMSKSLGNVVNPDDIIKEYGADTLRLYEMFIGPFDQAVAWNSKAVSGVRRFLDKVYGFKERVVDSTTTIHATHQLIKKVTEDIETMSFNTCISQMMIWSNTIEKEESLSKKDLSLFLQMLAPFAPHIAEELWQEIGMKESVHSTPWPEFDPSMLMTSEVTMAFQVSGKLRGTIEVSRDMTDEEVMDIVKKHEMYQKYIGNQGFKKVIIVKNKIVNIVI